MQFSKSASFHPLLSSSSRQFYSRRVPAPASSNHNLQKIVQILQKQHANNTYRNHSQQSNHNQPRMRTEQNESNHNDLEYQITTERFKLSTAIKRQPNKQWKQMYECFQKFKSSTTRQIMLSHQLQLINKWLEIMKSSFKNEENRVQTSNVIKRYKKTPLDLQKIKLLKQNQMLKERISEGETSSNKIIDYSCIYQPKKESIQLPQTNKQFNDRIMDLQGEIQALKDLNQNLRTERSQFHRQIQHLKLTKESLCQQIVKSKLKHKTFSEQSQTWRNIMMMQNQQIIALKRDRETMQNEMKVLNNKYAVTLKRINSLTSHNQHNLLIQINKQSLQMFSQQLQTFQKVKTGTITKGYYKIVNKDDIIKEGTTYKTYLGEKQSLENPSGVKRTCKDYHRYYRPTFFVFVSEYLQNYGISKQNYQHMSSSVGINILCTIRNILDSKHNQYLLTKNHQQFTSIPAFTLSWLASFSLNPKNKKVQQVHTDLNLETISSFYLQLMNSCLNSNWEAITFRQLLMQTLTTDQTLFYLKCRFELMGGDSSCGTYYHSQIYYVSVMQAVMFIGEIVVDLDYRKKLQEFIRRSVETQKKKQLIDVNFVLRLLLEYYQFKKNRMLSALSKTFATYCRKANRHVEFQSFLKLFEYNSFHLSLKDKAEIYKKAFSLGNGTIALETIFTVLNEEGYFCRQAENMFKEHPLPKIEEQTVGFVKDVSHQIVEQSQQLYSKAIKKQLGCIGIQQIVRQSAELFQGSSYESLIERCEFVIQTSFMYLKKLFSTKIVRQRDLAQIMSSMLPFVKHFLEATLRKKQSWLIRNQAKKRQACRIVYRCYRKKNYYYSSYTPVRKVDKDDQKIQGIKNEFSSLLDTIKNKIQKKQSYTSHFQ